LDIRANPALETLFCQENSLKDIDISANAALTVFYRDKNVAVTGSNDQSENADD